MAWIPNDYRMKCEMLAMKWCYKWVYERMTAKDHEEMIKEAQELGIKVEDASKLIGAMIGISYREYIRVEE